MPVPAIETTSLSPLRIACATWICQRHGLILKTFSVFFRTSESEGTGGCWLILGVPRSFGCHYQGLSTAITRCKTSCRSQKLISLIACFQFGISRFFGSPLSLVTVAAFVYRCFVPGSTEWLKGLTFRTFKDYHLVIQIRLDITTTTYTTK